MKKLENYFVAIGLALFSVVSLASSSSVFPAPPLKEKNVLTVCSYSEFKPVSYGVGQGYEADFLRAVSELWSVKIKFYPEKIYEGIWRLPSRPYTLCDIAIGGITPTEARMKENAAFSRMTTLFNQSLLIRKKDYTSHRITSYASFKNAPYKIGVVPGTTGELYAHVMGERNGLPPDVFVQYASESELLPALMSGKIDAIARGEIGNKYQALLNKNVMTIAEENFHEGFSFAVDSSNRKLRNALDSVILAVSDCGKIDYTKWLNDHSVFVKQLNKLKSIGAHKKFNS